MHAECQICGRAVSEPLACSGCGAMLYCSEQHMFMHAQQSHSAQECARMAQQMESHANLLQAPLQMISQEVGW